MDTSIIIVGIVALLLIGIVMKVLKGIIRTALIIGIVVFALMYFGIIGASAAVFASSGHLCHNGALVALRAFYGVLSV